MFFGIMKFKITKRERTLLSRGFITSLLFSDFDRHFLHLSTSLNKYSVTNERQNSGKSNDKIHFYFPGFLEHQFFKLTLLIVFRSLSHKLLTSNPLLFLWRLSMEKNNSKKPFNSEYHSIELKNTRTRIDVNIEKTIYATYLSYFLLMVDVNYRKSI